MGLRRYYRFADGSLCLATDDTEFAARFHALYCECLTDEPQSGLVVFCEVAVAARERVRVTFNPAIDPRLIARLARTDAPPQIPQTPPVTVGAGFVDVEKGGAWQWLVGNLVVNVLLALQPDLMFFHAATIAIHGRGVLIMGDRGSGKTSVALALAARGHGFLGEELGALRLATGELVPVRRSAQVRQGAGEERLNVPVGARYPQAAGRPVPLEAVVRLRRFASETRLEPLPWRSGNLDGLTLMACSLARGDNAGRIARLLALLGPIPAYALDSASPESAAELLERTLGG